MKKLLFTFLLLGGAFCYQAQAQQAVFSLVSAGGEDNMTSPDVNIVWSFGEVLGFDFGAGILFLTPKEEVAIPERDIRLWNNPSDGQIQLLTPGGQPLLYQVFNASGQLMKSGQLNGVTSVISTHQLAAGTYYLHLLDEQGRPIQTLSFINL